MTLRHYSTTTHYKSSRHQRYQHSFPTRRSSDLILREERAYNAETYMVLASQPVVDRLLDEESAAVADLETFIGKTIRFQVDRKSTRLNSSHVRISYAVFCLKKNNKYAHTVFTDK